MKSSAKKTLYMETTAIAAERTAGEICSETHQGWRYANLPPKREQRFTPDAL